MGPIGATRACLSRYFQFSGRARRPEFWWFALVVLVGGLVVSSLDHLLFGGVETMHASMQGPGGSASATSMRFTGPQPLSWIFNVAVIVPSLAVGWRRMHDTGRAGWLSLLPLIVLAIAGALSFVGALGMSVGGGPFQMMVSGGLGMAGMLAYVFGPLIAMIVLIFWLAGPTQPGDNAFGPEPPAV